VRCVFVGVGGVTTREEMKKCDDMSDDDENEIVCVRVLFSSFGSFFVLAKKTKKFSSKHFCWILMTGRGINFCLTETKE